MNIKKIYYIVFVCLVNALVSLTLGLMYNKDVKYILFWSSANSPPFKTIEEFNSANNCPVKNCYFTSNRDYFGGGLKYFDAILFNVYDGEKYWFKNNLPKQRFSHQVYVFVSSEPTVYNPICTSIFDNFFNWTWTYRLDSDCPMRYFTIRNMKGEIVGPKTQMDWVDMRSINYSLGSSPKKQMDLVDMRNVNNLGNSPKKQMNLVDMRSVNYSLGNDPKKQLDWVDMKSVNSNLGTGHKTKAAAWFVSNCETRSKRNNIVNRLQQALNKYNHTVDIYGACGNQICIRDETDRKCERMLENDYYFYLALENSICEDYVTEKLLRAMQSFVIPIVLTGINYERFLPPHSYLEIGMHNCEEVAKQMYNLIENPDLYLQYFKWSLYYTYVGEGIKQSTCDFCKLLNDENKTRTYTLYVDIRSWWNDVTKWWCGPKAVVYGKLFLLSVFDLSYQSLLKYFFVI